MARADEVYARTLDRIANAARRGLLTFWDALDTYDEASQLLFVEQAAPLLDAAATATVAATDAYMATIGVDPTAGYDATIVADATARAFDPFDRLARNLSNGMPWEDAIVGARSVASDLGNDAVFRTARTSMAVKGATLTDWQRKLRGGCCQWCMKLSSVVFDFAGDATFGHANCRCIPFPVEQVADANAATRADEGFDAKAEALYNQRQAANRQRQSARNARSRAEQARTELATEADPGRRLRLERRAADWDARAEAADLRAGLLAA